MSARIVLFLLGLTFAFNVLADERRLDRNFSVQPGGTLTVDADGANITVRGENTDRVHVVVVFEGSSSALENVRLSAEAKGQGVEVIAKRGSGGWLSWFSFGDGSRADVTVTVPSRYEISNLPVAASRSNRFRGARPVVHRAGASMCHRSSGPFA